MRRGHCFFSLLASVGVVVQIFLDWQFNLFEARLLVKFYLSMYVMLDFM